MRASHKLLIPTKTSLPIICFTALMPLFCALRFIVLRHYNLRGLMPSDGIVGGKSCLQPSKDAGSMCRQPRPYAGIQTVDTGRPLSKAFVRLPTIDFSPASEFLLSDNC